MGAVSSTGGGGDGSGDSRDLCTGDDNVGDSDGDDVCDDIDPCPLDRLDDSDNDKEPMPSWFPTPGPGDEVTVGPYSGVFVPR